jgi:hypothetical protein
MKYVSAFIILSWLGCQNIGHEKFDKSKWQTKDDMEYPHRDKMLKDLTTNYKWVGLHKDEVISMLGKPNYGDSSYMGYNVLEKYGWTDIDPVYTKDFVIQLTKDSTVKSVKVNEWEK